MEVEQEMQQAPMAGPELVRAATSVAQEGRTRQASAEVVEVHPPHTALVVVAEQAEQRDSRLEQPIMEQPEEVVVEQPRAHRPVAEVELLVIA